MTGTGIWKNLTVGHGPTITDWFLEPTCPHCARAFGKLPPLLEEAGEDRLTIRLTVHSQPWHLFSSVVSRAVLAATLLPDAAAWTVLGAVFENRDDFVATEHSHGPNMDLSPNAVVERIAERSGIDVRETFVRREVTGLLKAHTRYARQNGIHMSPTVMVDGLVNDGIGSRDDIGSWLAAIGLS